MGISENISNSIGVCLQTGFVSEAISIGDDNKHGLSKYLFLENMTTNPIRDYINKN